MKDQNLANYLENLIETLPSDWLKLTTHRLDIYHEDQAKVEFIEGFEALYQANQFDTAALSELPTAYDYIRLGHPLSSVLEWAIAKEHQLPSENVIAFSSQSMPMLAILRKNLFDQKKTQILYTDQLPSAFDEESIKRVYGYQFELIKIDDTDSILNFDGTTVLISSDTQIGEPRLSANIDFFIGLEDKMGSILCANAHIEEDYISAIQHVRRRESIAMTPDNCFTALKSLIGKPAAVSSISIYDQNKAKALKTISEITGSKVEALLGSCGLSIQYAIMMGLVDEAETKYPGKDIKILLPTNCYGGTNDQARRMAAALRNVEVLDLEVDGENDMVNSIDQVLAKVADQDAVPYIIAEIPTNPRVEVPVLKDLKVALEKDRKTPEGKEAIKPVFILDQTFCPNIQFLSESGILSGISTISYVSGSKFPSGGKCTAGYCVANQAAGNLMKIISKHLVLCDNQATPLQVEILAQQLPSMNSRIKDAYTNTREFVEFIKKTLPEAKINFVSEDLAEEGFTPSVFSLDLPTKGETHAEREEYKRALNLKLINRMITQIPEESKYCVSYGQLKGCYWTIPATSTQGTTKEEHKDYIARVSVAPDLDLEKHKEVFAAFVEEEIMANS